MAEPKLTDVMSIEFLRQLCPAEQEAVLWGLEQEFGAEEVAKARAVLNEQKPKPAEPEPEEERKAAVAKAPVLDLRAQFNRRVAQQRKLDQAKVVQLKPTQQAPEPIKLLAEARPEEAEPLPQGSLDEQIARLEAQLKEKKALIPTNLGRQLVTPGMAAQQPVVALNEMNKKHAVITNLGGKCVVMEWVPSELNPEWEEPSYQSFTAFRERYANRYVEISTDITGKVQKIGAEPLAGWWLSLGVTDLAL